MRRYEIVCETRRGFHASLGRGNPCTVVSRKRCGTSSLLERVREERKFSALSLSEERVRESCGAQHLTDAASSNRKRIDIGPPSETTLQLPAKKIASLGALSNAAPLPAHSFGAGRPLLGQGEVVEKRAGRSGGRSSRSGILNRARNMRAEVPLTRAFGAASPATKRARQGKQRERVGF
jgi:hypothetical protein